MKISLSLTRINIFIQISLFLLAGLSSLNAVSQSPSDTIIFPSGTLAGCLPNGFRYYVCHNENPPGRVEFRLAWAVGSLQQNDEEGGCAHFLEHIAFGGTKYFPQRRAVEYLESMGMKYGVDINAFTGHDRTIYMFAVPADKVNDPFFSKPLSIIRDWTDSMTINPERVETEKGIILEELRSYTLDDPFYFLKIGQGIHKYRMPLGSAYEIAAMTPATLSAFYNKWYQPSSGALIVVGEVDPKKIEKEIIRQFASLHNNPNSAPREYPLQYTPTQQVMVDIDSLRRNEQLDLIIPHQAISSATISEYVEKETYNILCKALNVRFSERNIPAEVADNWYLSDTNHFSISMTAHNDESLDSTIREVASEIACILRDGFLHEEIEPIKKNSAARIHKNSNHKRHSDELCDDFIDSFLTGDRYPSDSLQIALTESEIVSLPPSRLRKKLAEIVSLGDSTMLFALNTTPDFTMPMNAQSFLSAWKRGLDNPNTPYVFLSEPQDESLRVNTPSSLISSHPFSDSQISRVIEHDGIRVREVHLKNGITLILKPTTEKESVLFSSIIPGGYAAIPDSSFFFLSSAPSYIDMGMIANGGPEISEFMYQNGMSLSSTMENDWHGLIGGYPSGLDQEFLNLVYEKITNPELRYDDFESIRGDMLADTHEESLLSKMLKRDPARIVSNKIDKLMGAAINNPMENPSAEEIAALSLDSMGKFYSEIYSQPENAVYLFCGDFNPDTVTQKFAALFSELTSSRHPSFRKTSRLSLPKNVIVERIPSGDSSLVNFDYVFYGQYTPGLRNSLILKLMRLTLQNRMIAELRENKSLVYSPWAGLTYEGIPRGYFYFDLSSSCNNENMEAVNISLMHIIEQLRHNPISFQELDAMKESFIVNKRESLGMDASPQWRSTLTDLVKNNETLSDFNRYEEILQSISPSDIQEGFVNLISPNSFVLLYVSDFEFIPNNLPKNNQANEETTKTSD